MTDNPKLANLRELYARGELTCEAAGELCRNLCTVDLVTKRVVDPDCFR